MNDPIVIDSAFKHGISRAEILHAHRNALRWWELDEGFEMYIGPDRSGLLLEIGVVVVSGEELIVHAMAARAKFLPRGRK